MKRAELVFNLIAIPLDAAMVLASAVFAYFLRIKFAAVWPIIFDIRTVDYLSTIAFILPFLLGLFALYGLYNMRSTDSLGLELSRILAAVTTALMLVVLIFFFNRDVFPSRLIVLMSWITTLLFVSWGRVLLRFIRDRQLRRGIGAHRMVVVAGESVDSRIVDTIRTNPELGYQIVAMFNSSEVNLTAILENFYKEKGLDEILQADARLSPEANAALVRFAHDRGIRFNFVPDIFDVSATRIEVEMLYDAPIIKLKGTPLDGWGRVAKRVMDILISLVALVILSPLILLIAILIKLNSRGPIIFRARRASFTSDFEFYKFRSMYTHLSTGQGYGGDEAEKVRKELSTQNQRGGPLIKIRHDPRVTAIGRVIRKFKLDEIPQFWNVLRGDMSLVGPRAHVLDEVGAYRDEYKRLFIIKPGITGLTQIAQMQKPDLPFDEEVRLDTYYIDNWSLWLDIKIIWRTFWMLITKKFSTEDY